MLLLLLALAGASVLAPFLIRVIGRPAFGLLAITPAIGFGWVLSHLIRGTFDSGGAIVAHYGWMTSANLNLTFRLDSLSALFSLIILGVGTLVLLYCWGYFDNAPKRLRWFAGQMAAFAMAMYGLVISDNLLLMYVFWEITSILSFLLVGYYGERASSRRSATQALMITGLGGLIMLVGIILLGKETGAWTISQLVTMDLAGTNNISWAIVLMLAGALTKSAIAPAHFWLPGAMAAPTPVSAYLHSAAMVKAGIYLVARLSPAFNFAEAWYLVIMPLGILTMVMAGWMSLRQKDLKLILAYGTVSQLGFMITVVGIGSREALLAGLALTFAHSLFKATLFMIVGAIDHCSGTRDVREISGLGRKQPLLALFAFISAASMAGIPPLFGFVAKEAVLEMILHEPLLIGMPGKIMLVGYVVGSIMTMAYSLHFLHGAFSTKPKTHPTGGGVSPAVENMHRVGFKLLLAPAVLTTLTVVLGLFPKLISQFLEVHVHTVHPLAEGEKASYLALWHGFTVPLLISAVIVTVGAIMFWQRHLVAKLYFQTPALGNANDAYDSVLDFLRNVSLRLTASTQRGSLAINLGIIFLCLALTPMVSLLLGERTDIRMELWNSPLQGVAAVIIILMSIAVTVMHNRLSALVMTGVIGYCIAFIFATYGAPDLALTQLLIETTTMVIFMLVLRRLPADVTWQAGPRATRFRAWMAVTVGVAVTVFGVFAVNARSEQSVASFIPDLAYEIGHGANAVNVLLVDIRAWDTFGESMVLVIAAVGVTSLVYRTRSFRRSSRRPTLSASGRRWLASSGADMAQSSTEKARNRSLLVDVVTRLLFPSMMVLSVYFFFVGHNAPGGGFAGGLVAALALTLRYLAGGRDELEATFPIDASRVLGIGMLLSISTAIVPIFLGNPPLTSYYFAPEIPLIGKVSITSVLVFDAGVYLVVVGLILHILDSLGAQLDRDEDMRKQRARDRARRLRRDVERKKALQAKKAAERKQMATTTSEEK